MIDNRTAPYAALLLRIALGVMFLAHGLTKLLVFTPAGTAGFFQSVGFPGFLAYPVIAFEILAGILLVLGGLRPLGRSDRGSPVVSRINGPLRQRLELHQHQRRLGVSGVPRNVCVGRNSDGRRRMCAQAIQAQLSLQAGVDLRSNAG